MPEDEDDWDYAYPAPLLKWLYGILQSVDYHWTPLEILECERRYPGLLDALAVFHWQVKRADPPKVVIGGQEMVEW